MKNLRCMPALFLVFLFLGLQLTAQETKSAQSALTNQDIVDLTKTGLSPDIIVAKIRTSTTHFDTSSAGLKGLKAAGVPDAVILAMVDPSNKTAAPAGSSKSDAAGSGPAFVRVYRPRFLPGNNFSPPIYVDGKEVFTLSNGKRCSVRVDPGKHTITSDDKSSMIEIDAKPGQEFYVSVQEFPGGFLKGRGKLTMVANEQGKPEYKIEKPLEEDRKIAKEMIEPELANPEASGDQPAAK
jgi:hypothetical protein